MKTIDWANVETKTTRKQTALAVIDALIGILTIGAFLIMVAGIFIMIG